MPFLKRSLLLLVLGFSHCTPEKTGSLRSAEMHSQDSLEVVETLNAFHAAAAKSDLTAYFSFFSEDAVFIGTDATEYWNKKAFLAYAEKPFASGKGWAFKAVQRNVYLDATGTTAWFDELLDAPYAKIARGSGVLSKTGTGWKVRQYVLSMTIPNALSDSIVTIKSPLEQVLLDSLQQQ